MINLDERYHSYLDGSKKMRIDGMEERVKAYGWHCDGSDIVGHYVTTENYQLSYNQLAGSYEDEQDTLLTEYYECLIECDEDQAVCKRICREVLH